MPMSQMERSADIIVAELYQRNQEMRDNPMRDVTQAQEHAVRSCWDVQQRLREYEEITAHRVSRLEGELSTHRLELRQQESRAHALPAEMQAYGHTVRDEARRPDVDRSRPFERPARLIDKRPG